MRNILMRPPKWLGRILSKIPAYAKMTDICKECRFRDLCEEMKYELECHDQDKCDRYEAYLEGLESMYYMSE